MLSISKIKKREDRLKSGGDVVSSTETEGQRERERSFRERESESDECVVFPRREGGGWERI